MSKLFVRLPNHIGDACMSMPALDLLEASGFDLSSRWKALRRRIIREGTLRRFDPD